MHHVRVDLAEANEFVAKHHRHHNPVQGHLFSIGAQDGDKIVGVVIVGLTVKPQKLHDFARTAQKTPARFCTDVPLAPLLRLDIDALEHTFWQVNREHR